VSSSSSSSSSSSLLVLSLSVHKGHKSDVVMKTPLKKKMPKEKVPK
jgi:hypothetical protein